VTEAELHAEARRRFLRANPTITPEAFDTWLAFALSRGATVILQLDGCRASYPAESAAPLEVKGGRA